MTEIVTARTEDAINEGAKAGYWPLVKRVIPSKKIHTKFAVFQNKETGEIASLEGLFDRAPKGMVPVIEFTTYYPHQFASPFAAYLIPPNLKAGERVFVPDVIEDLVELRYAQGDTTRLMESEAIWDGKDLIMQFKTYRTDYMILG